MTFRITLTILALHTGPNSIAPSTFPFGVPSHGDCFYNAIQLFLYQLSPDPFLISIPQLHLHRIKHPKTLSSIPRRNHNFHPPLAQSLSLYPHCDSRHLILHLQPLPLQCTTTANKCPSPPQYFIHSPYPNPISSPSPLLHQSLLVSKLTFPPSH